MAKYYSEAHIKDTFWKTFHEAGGIRFLGVGSPEENQRSTEQWWYRFLQNLEKTTPEVIQHG